MNESRHKWDNRPQNRPQQPQQSQTLPRNRSARWSTTPPSRDQQENIPSVSVANLSKATPPPSNDGKSKVDGTKSSQPLKMFNMAKNGQMTGGSSPSQNAGTKLFAAAIADLSKSHNVAVGSKLMQRTLDRNSTSSSSESSLSLELSSGGSRSSRVLNNENDKKVCEVLDPTFRVLLPA